MNLDTMTIFENRNELLNIFDKNINICEIGVFKGEFSKLLYEIIKPNELHLIDIFEGKMCSGDKDGNNIVWTNLNDEYNFLLNYFSPYKNIFIHKGKSSILLKNFDDDFFDLIYIDGDHSYIGVKEDLKISYNKIKHNGYICGHDYTNDKFPGVFKAVNEFCEEKNLSINYLTKDGCPTFCIKNEKNLG